MHHLMDVTATAFEPLIRKKELGENTFSDANEVSRAFISSDGQFGLTIGYGQNKKHYEVDEFKTISTTEVYEEVFKNLNSGKIKIEQDKASMITITYLDVLKKMTKKNKRKCFNRKRNFRIYHDECTENERKDR